MRGDAPARTTPGALVLEAMENRSNRGEERKLADAERREIALRGARIRVRNLDGDLLGALGIDPEGPVGEVREGTRLAFTFAGTFAYEGSAYGAEILAVPKAAKPLRLRLGSGYADDHPVVLDEPIPTDPGAAREMTGQMISRLPRALREAREEERREKERRGSCLYTFALGDISEEGGDAVYLSWTVRADDAEGAVARSRKALTGDIPEPWYPEDPDACEPAGAFVLAVEPERITEDAIIDVEEEAAP